jgi:hypothetical protein
MKEKKELRTSALSHPRPEDLLLQSPEARIRPSAAIAGEYHTFGHFYQLNHRETQTQFHCHTKTAAHTHRNHPPLLLSLSTVIQP